MPNCIWLPTTGLLERLYLVGWWRGKLHAREENPGLIYFGVVSVVALALVYQRDFGGHDGVWQVEIKRDSTRIN